MEVIDVSRITIRMRSANMVIVDAGSPICIKNRFGLRNMLYLNKEEFTVEKLKDVYNTSLEESINKYCGKKVWIEV